MCAMICAMPRLRNMQDLQLLMFHWRWFSGCSREHGAVVIAVKGCQYLINGCLQPIGTWITQDVKLKFVDAPLTLILRRGRSPCHCLCCLSRQLICRLCITATRSLVNDSTYKTTNCWRSIVAHSQNGVVTVLLSFLPIKAANTSVMHNSDQMTVQLPFLQDHKSLMLRWRSLRYIVHSISAAIDNCFYHDLNLLVIFLSVWDSALWQSRVQ